MGPTSPRAKRWPGSGALITEVKKGAQKKHRMADYWTGVFHNLQIGEELVDVISPMAGEAYLLASSTSGAHPPRRQRPQRPEMKTTPNQPASTSSRKAAQSTATAMGRLEGALQGIQSLIEIALSSYEEMGRRVGPLREILQSMKSSAASASMLLEGQIFEHPKEEMTDEPTKEPKKRPEMERKKSSVHQMEQKKRPRDREHMKKTPIGIRTKELARNSHLDSTKWGKGKL